MESIQTETSECIAGVVTASVCRECYLIGERAMALDQREWVVGYCNPYKPNSYAGCENSVFIQRKNCGSFDNFLPNTRMLYFL